MVLFIAVQNEDAIPRLEKLLDKLCGGFDNPGTGILFTIPVDYARGLVPEEEEEDDEDEEEEEDEA